MTEPLATQPQQPSGGALVPTEPNVNRALQAADGDSAKRVARVQTQSRVLALDTGMWEQMQRVALAMASATLLPEHLVAQPWWWRKGMSPAEIKKTREELGAEEFARSVKQAEQRTVANCFLVVEQAFRWGFSPFAVAPETYGVGGKLAFQGKLVIAVVNELAGLEGRLRYEWSGEGLDRTIEIRGRFIGENEDRVSRTVLRSVKTDNKMWVNDPDQKLLYTAATRWARRFCPEVVLGLRTPEDVEAEEAEKPAPRAALAPSALDAFAGSAPPPPVVGQAGAEPEKPVPVDEEVSRTADPAPTQADALPAAAAGENGPSSPVEPPTSKAAPEPEPEFGAVEFGAVEEDRSRYRLSPKQLAELKKLCSTAKLSWGEDVEKHFESVIDTTFEHAGMTSAQLEAEIVDFIRTTAKSRR